ncbi:uncharacterized protein N7483_011675 [Penicillium malachiteum]|uniref:uncharacterized protein n=1 Tax=Penicillium malachiteum TaxID=1324776 RepID=UPI002548B319|nr:uncharacterized protein N7483_011675 [Penicillium malachiteum]KAJ5714494.1 hypothetical protein N7483_011675 [Penicillium malachiteum]
MTENEITQEPIVVDDDDELDIIDQGDIEPDSNERLARDEDDAIDESNIIEGHRTRHAKPMTSNQYNEGPSEDEIPQSTG